MQLCLVGLSNQVACEEDTLMCSQGRRHEDSDSEDEWTDEEDDSEALDTADPFLYFADTLRVVQMQHPARFQVKVLHATAMLILSRACFILSKLLLVLYCNACCFQMVASQLAATCRL